MVKSLIIRADATPQMGTGHVMRCLALAQAAQEQGVAVRFVSRVHVPWVHERLLSEQLPLVPLADAVTREESPADLLGQLEQAETAPSDTWVALDGYHFTISCQRAVQRAGYRLLVIDDYTHLPEYSCDVLLNQNLGADELSYAGDIGCRLLGPHYALLRREFREAKKSVRPADRCSPPKRILVTLGGGNFIEPLERIAREMSMPELEGRTVRVIQGGMDESRIRRAFSTCPAQLEVLSRVHDMPTLLLETDMCITAGGSTCWELCCLEVPFLAVQTADNQKYIIKYFKTNNMLFSGKAFQNALLELPSSFSSNTQRLYAIDGQGAQRVVNVMSLHDRTRVEMRKARLEDKQFVFDVVNSELVRKMSFESHKITLNEHDAWFRSVVNEKMPFYLFSIDSVNVGYVRFSGDGQHCANEAVLTIAIDTAFRQKGLGKVILAKACNAAFDSGIKKIWAYVKKENLASAKLFKACGFMTELNQVYKGFDVYAFSLERR